VETLAEDHAIVIGANTYRVLSQIVAEEEDPSSARMAEIRRSCSPRRRNRR
jgi:hypothetical protein